MTLRQVYEAVQIELNKENAPNILLEDFNYFANKAINQYINKRYNIYDVNQQTTDDLRTLKSTAILIPRKVNNIYNGLTLSGNMATYEVDLPSDYLHLLNCIVIYNVRKTYKCYNRGDTWRRAATRLTADAYSQVLDNFWLKPSYKRPYYYIHNVNAIKNSDDEFEMDYYDHTKYYDKNEESGKGVDLKTATEATANYDNKIIPYITPKGTFVNLAPGQAYENSVLQIDTVGQLINNNKALVYNSNKHEFEFTGTPLNAVPQQEAVLSNGVISYTKNNITYSFFAKDTEKDYHGNSIISLSNEMFSKNYGNETSNIERAGKLRYGNASKVRLEIRYGTDSSIFDLSHNEGDAGGYIYIDYIKAPQFMRLTQEELDYTEDRSQTLEFPDYVCQEIINELVLIIMENIRDQRVSTHPVVSQSIANPAQAQAPEAAGQSAQ